MRQIELDAELFAECLRQLGYVKVIRCRDCIHRCVNGEAFRFECDLTGEETKEDGYCDRAERKDNG